MTQTISLDSSRYRPDVLLFEYYQQQNSIRRSDKYNERKQRALMNLIEYVIRYDLTEKQRKCVRLVKVQGFKEKDVAAMLGVAPSTVCRFLKRAQKSFDKAYDHFRCVNELLNQE